MGTKCLGQTLPEIFLSGSGSSKMSPATRMALTELRRATSKILPTTSIRARDSFLWPSVGKEGKRRPRCQSAVCSSFSTTSPESPARSRMPTGTASLLPAPGSEGRNIFRAIFCRPRLPWIRALRYGVRDVSSRVASWEISASIRSRAVAPTTWSRRFFPERKLWSRLVSSRRETKILSST